MNKFRRTAAGAAASVLILCSVLTGCGKKENNDDASLQTSATTSETTAFEEETISIYTGKEVENEEDLAIFKFNAVLPDGYETVIDSAEGKQYISPNGLIVVKAQNYKEEFQELEVFADQGCASINISNMLHQADTEFSEPQKTTVGGFDAIKYDYYITAYQYEVETDAEGEIVTDENGAPITTDERFVIGEYVNRVYYFYSDEDAFYIICESPKVSSEKAAAEFDEFIGSISITKK